MSFLLETSRKARILQQVYALVVATLQEMRVAMNRTWRRVLRHSPLIFLREVCTKPRSMGTICPSSRYLARRMAQAVPVGKGLVVELGAGTGTVTEALHKNMGRGGRLWAVEQSPALADMLAQRLPAVRVVQGDARQLAQMVPAHAPVDAIVSCLPLRSFAPRDVHAIAKAWAEVLPPHGVVVQFTYALWNAHMLQQYGFKEESSTVVWRNFPPARVQILRKMHGA